ncbi:hypothetical protein ACFYOF_06245 [Streptomyces sp. NPDC007148]|uniref:hypothetical protein n=1 Tax=unclassified Streptomyces TaxID=2593676 RepID=UPI0036801911
MPKIRTTMRPDQEIEVDDIEAADLSAQGLLVDDSPTPAPEPAPQTAIPAAAKKSSTSKES